MPVPFKHEEDVVLGLVLMGGDMGSVRRGVGIIAMREDLRSLSERLKNHGFYEVHALASHLEKNQLTGALPTTLVNLPNLRELYMQNNMLTVTVSSDLRNKYLVLK